MPDHNADRVWARFGDFELDSARGLLSVKGYAIKLQSQPLRVLELLVRRAPAVVTREELGDHVWGAGVHVELDANLYYCIRQIRLALRDNANQPRYVETLPKQGYRMVAAVEQTERADEVAKVLEVPEAGSLEPRPAEEKRGRRWVWVAATALGGALALAAIGGLVRKHGWGQRQSETPIRSVAVLPLQNLSGDSGEDYFADGMTDELITELASLPNLRVVSRTSAMAEKGSQKTLRQIAGELDVDAIVEGSVVRSGERVRITVQLIDARDDRHIWAKSFEGQPGDVVALQDSVAAQIAAQARVVLAPDTERANGTRTINPAAYDAYLRGRYFYAKGQIERSADYFQQAIAADPAYAAAYAGLSDDLEAETVFGTAPIDRAMPQALAAAQHAIQLDPKSGEAYEALGSIETIYQWNWDAAELDLLRSVALAPSYSVAEMKYGTLLDATGRQAEALNHMRRAVALDPLSFYMVRRLGVTLYFARDYDAALEQLRRAAEMEPRKHDVVDNWMSAIYEQKGMHDEAVEHDLAALQSTSPQLPIEQLRSVYKRRGWIAYWQARTAARHSTANNACGGYDLGKSYLRMGDLDNAFAAFNRLVDGRCFNVVLLRPDPALDPIRGDRRYRDLLQRVNLAER